MTVVVGVDGAGRTYRLGRLADAAGTRAWWVGSGDLAAGLASATLVVADDAHRLAPEVLRALTAAARSGVRVLMSRRPTIDSPELADLDEAAAAGGVELLAPLDRDGVGALVAAVTGRPVSPEIAAAVHEVSAGLPGVAAAVASALPTGPASGGAGASAKSGGVRSSGGPVRAGSGAMSRGAGSPTGPDGTGSGAKSRSAGSHAGPDGTGSGAMSRGSGSGAGLGDAGSGAMSRGARSGAGPGGGSGAVAGAAVLGVVAPALLARVQRRFAVLPRQVGAVARVLALRLDLADGVLADAAEVPADELPGVLRTLRDEGMLVPDRELAPTDDTRMIPAVADAVLGELSAAERRRLHDVAAGALAAAGADPLVTAAQLRAARVRTPAAAGVYRQAGELTRFTNPAAALAWFDDAIEAGAEPSEVVAGRAEASTLLGLPPDADLPTPPGSEAAARLARLAGTAAAHDGRADRAAELLLAAPPPGPLLAVPVLVGAGRLAEATTYPKDGSPSAMRLAEAVLVAARDPDAAVPLLIEAAEVSERVTPVAVLPDTPHAIGAVVAVLAGDVAGAEYLLTRAGIGGPAAAERHRLLLAWARMRAGRYDTALAELARPAGELPARERLLRAAIAAGMARRRGDIAGLRAVWSGVEPVLARRTVDLWQLEPMEELLVAAARLRQGRRVEPILELLARAVDQLGRPPAWAAALGWLRVQVAVAGDDPDTAATQARRLAEISGQAAQPTGNATGDRPTTAPGPVGHRAAAQCTAAALWAQLLATTPPPRRVLVLAAGVVALVVLAGVGIGLAALGGDDETSAGSSGPTTNAASSLPEDEQCTDAIMSNPRWVCLTSAIVADGKITIDYRSDGSPLNINGGYHLHVYGGDGTNPPAEVMGMQAPESEQGEWYIEDRHPAVLTLDDQRFLTAIGDAPKVCARIGDATHHLVPDTNGAYATGNCVPITRTASSTTTTTNAPPTHNQPHTKKTTTTSSSTTTTSTSTDTSTTTTDVLSESPAP